ncbi:beta-N-acetylhexosaminidase [Gramella sp. KN1008]|uniref:beta-N-acetylhexosaminidase n=1 Tax=Gramella sp. KN1008 TaxID=2529298 RepID=UPI001039950D|nr:beta-N-acetylhexosaminidase [Gramella sp. KN1008]TBW30258.1 beta-N-acetylglucosaminidase [Gramella sp. KN1008]
MKSFLKFKLLNIAWPILFLGLVFSSCSSPKYPDRDNKDEDYYVVPQPARLNPGTGAFLLSDDVAIQAGDFQKEAAFLRDYAKSDFQKDIKDFEDGKAISFALNSSLGEEAYELKVTPEEINIEGGSAKGIFYAVQSLRQLMLVEDGDLIVPAVEISDTPRFAYRGTHLDVARHFFEVDEVKSYLDILALHKINTFHWHLTEDQGWRIEIKQYPKLTEIGAYRNGTIVGHKPGTSNDNERTGGFYTQEQVKDIVAYAGERHITVIPEIELPGHSSAAIAAYPYLSCFPEEKTEVPNDMMSETSKEQQAEGRNKIVQETWGIFDDVYCAGKDSTFTFLQNVLDEVIPLFPSEYVHIGGDECPKANWERCPECQQRMAQEGLKDEHELQSYFIQRMEKYINSKGKKIIGWDEILEGGLAPNATVMSWRGEEGGIEAAKQGHDVIMTPTDYCYFDYYQAQDKEEEPLAIGGYLPVEKVYSYEPLPEELTSEQHEYILGTQANLWTEYIPDMEKLEYMLLPRLAALAEVGWTKNTEKDWEGFKNRLSALRATYDELGLNYATHVFNKDE